MKKFVASILVASIAVMSTACATATMVSVEKPDTDRAGNAITVADDVESIVSLSPSTTQTLIDLGVADKIVAVDTYSMAYAEDLAEDVVVYDMYNPDNESLIAAEPDIVFTSGMVYDTSFNPYQELIDAEICVAEIPSSTSIAAIQEDIVFIGECVGEADKAQDIVDEMNAQIDAIAEVASTIPQDEMKTVLFCLSVPSDDYPTIYSVGNDTFLNEMIADIGAINIAGDMDQWPALDEESVIDMNPDVILHSVSYIPNPEDEIAGRAGFDAIAAVENGEIYYIDENSSNQPNAHVVDAMIQMAKVVYPDYYAEFENPFA